MKLDLKSNLDAALKLQENFNSAKSTNEQHIYLNSLINHLYGISSALVELRSHIPEDKTNKLEHKIDIVV